MSVGLRSQICSPLCCSRLWPSFPHCLSRFVDHFQLNKLRKHSTSSTTHEQHHQPTTALPLQLCCAALHSAACFSHPALTCSHLHNTLCCCRTLTCHSFTNLLLTARRSSVLRSSPVVCHVAFATVDSYVEQLSDRSLRASNSSCAVRSVACWRCQGAHTGGCLSLRECAADCGRSVAGAGAAVRPPLLLPGRCRDAGGGGGLRR